MDTAALSILYTWIRNNEVTFLQVIYKAWHIQVGVCTVCVCMFIRVCVILCTCAWIYKSFLALCWPGWSYLDSVSYKMSYDEWEEFTDDLSVCSCVSLRQSEVQIIQSSIIWVQPHSFSITLLPRYRYFIKLLIDNTFTEQEVKMCGVFFLNWFEFFQHCL